MTEQESMSLPAAEGGGEAKQQVEIMPLGCFRMRIDNLKRGVNANKEPITDNRGHPSVRIFFLNENGDKTDELFWYNKMEMKDPTRNDEDKKCKSEWRLSNLRTAMKLDKETPLELEIAKGIFFYGVVRRVHHTDPNDSGRTVRSFNKLSPDFYPDADEKPELVGSSGNDEQDPVIKPSGVFVKYQEATTKDMNKWEPNGPPAKKETTEDAKTAEDTGEDVAKGPDF